jgi:subfamily B ATP-binding cassette protein MsbA
MTRDANVGLNMTQGDGPVPPKAWPLIKRLWPTMRPHMHLVWTVIAVQLLATPIIVLVPLVLRHVVDETLQRGSVGEMLRWALLIVVMGLVGVTLSFIGGRSLTLFRTRVIRSMRVRIYRHMQRLSRSYYQQRETGEIMSRQTDDVSNLGGIMADTFATVAMQALRGLLYLGMLFYIEWRMAAGGLGLVGLILGLGYLVSGRLRLLHRASLERWTRVSSAMHQSVSGHALVQSTATETVEALRFARVLHESVRANVQRDLFGLVTRLLMGLIQAVAPALIVLGSTYLIVTSDFTVGGMFAFFMVLSQLFVVVQALTGFNTALQGSLASLERIFQLLDTQPEVDSPAVGAKRLSVLGRLTFDDVSFAYANGRTVLKNIDLDIPPNSRVALVGHSGAGKSTLASLIPRFHDPIEGRLLVDGVDLRELDIRTYRRQVGIVPQDIFLFDRSIADNIGRGLRHVTRAQIRAAAEAANATEFIDQMPDGFDTVVGERGTRVSGGQRQRLAIAREILRDPRILILDEATSALDSRSEALIQEALERLLIGRTSVVIAHRLSTVIGSDLILVMDQGEIVERGRHDELMALDGHYAVLYRTQFEKHLIRDEIAVEGVG